MKTFVLPFDAIDMNDLPLVGGKNANLGEMTQTLAHRGISIPRGFAITADAFSELIEKNYLGEQIYPALEELNTKDVAQLAKIGHRIRTIVRSATIPEEVVKQIKASYEALCTETGKPELSVAVRSSATAEDLPTASFAGQQESFLNITGEQDLLEACRNCFASLFTDRAISYRANHKFDHRKVRLSIGVQQMVRADLGSAGVAFTLDTESGANNVILITSAYGLGENIVAGRVDPDEFLVSKDVLESAHVPILRRKLGAKQLRLIYSTHGTRKTKNIETSKASREHLSLTDKEVIQLAKWCKIIEEHYSERNGRLTPMDIEWAKDGENGALYIVQARPETVHSRAKQGFFESAFVLKAHSNILLKGQAVGTKIGAGKVHLINDVSELSSFKENEVLVTDMTDPDWEPVMKKAAAIITNRGGRTCHAAIVSREHGVPCIVGTGTATETLKNEQPVTVSCAEGEDGYVFDGILPFHEECIDWQSIGKPRTQIMVNMGDPSQALKASLLPVDGIGLTRIEFIITESVKVHPMALAHPELLQNEEEKERILSLLGPYRSDPKSYFIHKLAEGIGTIAGAFYPRPVIVRFSDFKTNEYANLLGGSQFEPREDNPMIGFRGASRYYDERYKDGFALECQAIKYLREEMGLKNIKVMVPFCRSPEEGRKVLTEMERSGLRRGENGLEVYIMSEIPSNVLRAKEFGAIFDGFSIGSNDLTQTVLGVDRDSGIIQHLFNERDPAVLSMLSMAIKGAKATSRPIGICGQAPTDFPDISYFLVGEGIDSISVAPDAVFKTIHVVLDAEKNWKQSSAKLVM